MSDNSQVGWLKQIENTVLVAHALYLSPLLITGVVMIVLPPANNPWRDGYQGLFYVSLIIALGSLFLSRWMYAQVIGRDSLEMRQKGIGFPGVITAFRSGVFFCSALGDMCATLGLLMYVLTRDTIPLAVLTAFWGAHFAAGLYGIKRARETVTLLAERSALGR